MQLNNQEILRFDSVSRTFKKGAFIAVDNVSLDICGGEIHSLIGPNGAGKTTLVKMAASMLAPSSGRILINGFDVLKHPAKARKNLGLVIGGELGFYPRATAEQNLKFLQTLPVCPTQK